MKMSGMRTFWRRIAVIVGSKTPPRAQRIAGMRKPSWKISVAFVGTEPAVEAADVLVVGHGRGEREEAPAREDRDDDREIGEMRAAAIRVVEEVDVPVLHGLGREDAA